MTKFDFYDEYLAQVPQDVREEFEQIEHGKKLPQLYSDLPFKKIYNPDIHGDRLTTLFQLIFKTDERILSSLKDEIPKASIYSKGTIVDILAKTSGNGVSDFEMQSTLQELIIQRMNFYTSDLILLQYSNVLSESLICRFARRFFHGGATIFESYTVCTLKKLVCHRGKISRKNVCQRFREYILL